ncbi:MAG: hypothetical protein R3F59_09410 [Myxococcota bacterium]
MLPDDVRALRVAPLTESFLRRPGVQAELAALSEADRADALAEIRRGFGYPEDAVARAAAVDARHEAAWAAGLAYWAARQDAADSELDALRARFFGDRASTIANEEALGFFRFTRPRVYGVN